MLLAGLLFRVVLRNVFGCELLGQISMTLRVVIMGASGDGLVVAQAIRDIFRHDQRMQLVGFLDDAVNSGSDVQGVPVLGGLASWATLDEDILFYPALHKVKKMFMRKGLIVKLGVPSHRWATIVHPTSTIADDVALGVGTFVASHVTIQPGCSVLDFASIRAGANLGHDAIIKSYCYVGPNSTLCGRAQMEEGSHLGPNAVIIDGVVVGQYAVVGAGSVATKDISPFDVCMGNPARKLYSTIGIVKRTESLL